MIRFHLFLFFLISAFGLFAYSSAQDVNPRGPGVQRFEQFKKIRLMEALQMDEETSIRFFSRYDKHQTEINSLRQKENKLIDDLQNLVKDKPSDADIDKIVQQLVENRQQIVTSQGQFLEELKEVLSAKQVAQYLVFERNFAQNVRDLMREMSQERRGLRQNR